MPEITRPGAELTDASDPYLLATAANSLLAVAYGLIGRKESSIDALRRFVALDPNHKDAAKAKAMIEDHERAAAAPAP